MLGIETHGSSIWHAINVETYKYSEMKKEVKTQADCVAIIAKHPDTINDKKEKLMCNLKVMIIIRFSLPHDTFCLVHSYDTAKGIWDKLKELYSGDDDLEHSLQMTLLSDFGSFV